MGLGVRLSGCPVVWGAPGAPVLGLFSSEGARLSEEASFHPRDVGLGALEPSAVPSESAALTTCAQCGTGGHSPVAASGEKPTCWWCERGTEGSSRALDFLNALASLLLTLGPCAVWGPISSSGLAFSTRHPAFMPFKRLPLEALCSQPRGFRVRVTRPRSARPG